MVSIRIVDFVHSWATGRNSFVLLENTNIRFEIFRNGNFVYALLQVQSLRCRNALNESIRKSCALQLTEHDRQEKSANY